MKLIKATVIDIDKIFQSHTFVNSPKRSANKFVILKNCDELLLITGEINRFPYHAKLLEWYCNKYNLTFSWMHKPDFLEIYENDYSICGGGYIKFHLDKNEYEFYGFSTAYGRFENKKLNYIIDHSPVLNTARISISK